MTHVFLLFLGSLFFSFVADAGWTLLASMPTPRSDLASVVLPDDSVLALGGSDNTSAISDVIEQFFPQNNTWSTYPTTLPMPRENYGAAILKGELYVIGGLTKRSPDGATASVDVLNLSTMKWRTGPALPQVLTGHRAVALPNDMGILVIGGFTYTNPFQMNDYHKDTLILTPATGIWRQTTTSLPYRMANIGAVVAPKASRAFVLGGGELMPAYTYVSAFDLQTEQWQEVGNMTVARSYTAPAIVNMNGTETLLAIGGMDGEFNPTNSVEQAYVVAGSAHLNFSAFAQPFPIGQGAMIAAAVNGGRTVVVFGGNSAYAYDLPSYS